MQREVAFEKWKKKVGRTFLTPLKPLVGELLGLGSHTIDASLKKIASLRTGCSNDLRACDYSWATEATSFTSVVDAHFQYQLMWMQAFGLEHTCKSLLSPLRVLRGSCIESRNHSPSVTGTAEYAFVAVPTAFVKGLYEFYRAHFDLACLGAKNRAVAPQMGQMTNCVGGQDIESGCTSNPKSSRVRLMELVAAYSAAHLFEIESLSPADFLNKPDIYIPDELSRAGTQVLADFGHLEKKKLLSSDEATQSKRMATAATYLSVAFALCHEVSHCLLGDLDDLANPGVTTSFVSREIREASADRIGMLIYAGLVNAMGKDSEVLKIVQDIPPACRYSLGPCGFFAAASSIWLARRVLESTGVNSNNRQLDKLSRSDENLKQIQTRRSLCNDLLIDCSKQVNGGALDAAGVEMVGAIAESYALENALNRLLPWRTQKR